MLFGCEVSSRQVQLHCRNDFNSLDQFHFKNESCIGWNFRGASGYSITQVCWNHKFSNAAWLHPRYAFSPSPHNSVQRERGRLPTLLTGIELRAVGEPAGVVYSDTSTSEDGIAAAFLEIANLQTFSDIPEARIFG